MKSHAISASDMKTEVQKPSSVEAEVADSTLVERVLKGDRAAFECLVRRYQASLFRRACWMGLDADTAADMVQDSFLRAYESLTSCREPDKFHSWAAQILRNKCLDYLKSAARRSVPLPDMLPEHSRNPEMQAEQSALRRELEKGIAALPEEQREAFLMKHVEDLSYDEMSEITGASVSALKMRVQRAREFLRVVLHT